MASDPKAITDPDAAPATPRDRGIEIFTYPKVIFFFPTLVTAWICGIGMSLIGDHVADPVKHPVAAEAEGRPPATTPPPPATARAGERPTTTEATMLAKHQRFKSPQCLFGILFLGIFAFNLLVMAIDFPRFTIIAVLLVVLLVTFVLLWVGAYFDYDLMSPLRGFLGNIYTVANAGFYYLFALIMTMVYAIIFLTRRLDYWEIRPNEILHNHGPLSDLERFPTTNLKFDKEVPDVLEYLFLGAGRLVLHVSAERRPIVLDNVLFINRKEYALKNMMGRVNVRVTTDQEMAGH